MGYSSSLVSVVLSQLAAMAFGYLKDFNTIQ